MLTKTEFKRIVNMFIMPLVAGTRLTGCSRHCKEYSEADSPSSLVLTIEPGEHDAPALLLSRAQHFTAEETRLVKNILAKWAVAFKASALGDAYVDVIAAQCKLVAIAEFVDPVCSKLLLEILEVMVDWSGQSYEGRRIAFSIGVENTNPAGASTATFREVVRGEYIKVMTSGHDTLLVCDPEGGVQGHVSLFEPDEKTLSVLDDLEHNLFAPIMYLPIARWAVEKRYAAALNPEGEILLFKDGSLLFARRRGKWFFFTHSAYLAGLSGRGRPPLAAKAVYQTMLDVSFARTGGCMGFWHGSRVKEAGSIAEADRLDTPFHTELSHKNRFLRRLINGRCFQELHRKLRLELVGIDGATVLLTSGEILAVGAILKIDGGSAGGGRAAAALELAKQGIGVKISNDGEITYWTAERLRHGPESPPTYAIG